MIFIIYSIYHFKAYKYIIEEDNYIISVIL